MKVYSGLGYTMTEEDALDEERKIKIVRESVDLTAKRLGEEDLDYEEARRLIEETRLRVLGLFPDKGEVFDLVYKPRFYRILDEKMNRL